MPTLQQLISGRQSYPVIRAYIKRRLVDANFGSSIYEASWQRVDVYDGVQRVVDWGSTGLSIDTQASTDESNFEIDDITLTVDNSTGFWNVETDVRSFFYPGDIYLTRNRTKIKIEAGYEDADGNEIGVATVFEGFITKVILSEDQTAKITCLSYLSVLDQYPISDLSLTGTWTISDVIDSIMNQNKITDFLPFVASSPLVDASIVDTSILDGSYWDVIKKLAFRSSSVPLVIGNVWSFAAREPGASSVWDFKGAGTVSPDIYSVGQYDDEGASRVRLYWESKESAYTATSSNESLKQKYLQKPQQVDLENYDGTNSQLILNGLLAYWGTPRPTISFRVPFMVNLINPLDKITLTIYGREQYPESGANWDTFDWDDGTLWDDYDGPINIADNTEFMVLSVTKNLQDWTTNIIAERVVN